MAEKIHLKLKKEFMPAIGAFVHTVGTTRIEVSDTSAQGFTLEDARVALGLKDSRGVQKFELANPEEVLNLLPEDYPQRAALNAGGIYSIADVRTADDERLLAISGIGKKSLEEIRKHTPASAKTKTVDAVIIEPAKNVAPEGETE